MKKSGCPVTSDEEEPGGDVVDSGGDAGPSHPRPAKRTRRNPSSKELGLRDTIRARALLDIKQIQITAGGERGPGEPNPYKLDGSTATSYPYTVGRKVTLGVLPFMFHRCTAFNMV